MQKSCRPAEDVSDTSPRERALKSVTFQESVSVISDGPAAMELESQQVGEVVQVRGLTHMFFPTFPLFFVFLTKVAGCFSVK